MSSIYALLIRLRQITLPSLISLLLLMQLVVTPGPISPDDSLDLKKADSVRVSLYNQNRPDSLRITGSSAAVILYSGGLPDTLSSGDYDLFLASADGKLQFRTLGKNWNADSVKVITDSSSTRLISDEFGYRHYSGNLHFKPAHSTIRLDSGISIINHVDLETYVASVVGSEMEFSHPEALKTQAVVSRTYALWSIQKSPYKDFDLRDHESSQVYFGNIQDKSWFSDATMATEGEILTWSDQLILAAFSSTCGGRTADNVDVWGGVDHPYLEMQNDAEACSISPHYSWTYSIAEDEFRDLVDQYYGFSFQDKMIEKDKSGRVQHVMLSDANADTLLFTGNEFRLFLNRHAGSLALRSTKYEWTRDGENILFKGNGLGHGIGLCQWGALGFARSGWSYKDILNFYFSGTKIVSLDSIESNTIRLYN